MITRETVNLDATGTDTPGVIIFPPLLYVGTLLLGLSLHWFWPLHLTHSPWRWISGAVMAGLSVVLGGWANFTMRRAGTNVIPSQPALAIVSNGPFRFTRNPIYLANAAIYLALALIFNTLWPFLLFVPMLLVLQWGIIRREERYLEAKFGEPYLAYKARVRRWL
jgi:protein-S-isoprenylcysteine O-methyltransferase Ste14